jgi:thiamine pyrophosphokinase
VNLLWIMPAEEGVAVQHRTVDPTGHRTVVAVAGGDPVPPHVAALLPSNATVIAADSGLSVAMALGLDVDVVVGDLDSVDQGDLADARANDVEVRRFPPDKDATDLAIAMDAAISHGADRIVLVGGHGGRFDHLLANALLLASPSYAEVEVIAHMGDATVHVVRRQAQLSGSPGELVSLLPVHGPARGVVTDGLLYELTGDDLPAGSTRGVSNEFRTPTATVTLSDGVLLAVQPGALGTHLRSGVRPAPRRAP